MPEITLEEFMGRWYAPIVSEMPREQLDTFQAIMERGMIEARQVFADMPAVRFAAMTAILSDAWKDGATEIHEKFLAGKLDDLAEGGQL